MDTTAQTAVKCVALIAEAIREAREIPSGHLYAQVMGIMPLEVYSDIIAIVKRAGLVSESGHMLKWVGPQIERSAS